MIILVLGLAQLSLAPKTAALPATPRLALEETSNGHENENLPEEEAVVVLDEEAVEGAETSGGAPAWLKAFAAIMLLIIALCALIWLLFKKQKPSRRNL